jgi:hypothetical protein
MIGVRSGYSLTRRADRKTTRRDEIYDFVCTYADEKDGPTPTIREISISFGLAYTTVYHHVIKLIAERRLRQEDGKLIVVDSEWIPPQR